MSKFYSLQKIEKYLKNNISGIGEIESGYPELGFTKESGLLKFTINGANYLFDLSGMIYFPQYYRQLNGNDFTKRETAKLREALDKN